MNIVQIYDGDNPCAQCLGWKRVDDGDGASWKHWAELPAQSAIAVQLGLVKPITCPRCHGTGIEPAADGSVPDAGGALCSCLHPGQLTIYNRCPNCGRPFFRPAADEEGRS